MIKNTYFTITASTKPMQTPYKIIRNFTQEEQDKNETHPTLCLSPESYDMFLQAGLLAHLVPTPSHPE